MAPQDTRSADRAGAFRAVRSTSLERALQAARVTRSVSGPRPGAWTRGWEAAWLPALSQGLGGHRGRRLWRAPPRLQGAVSGHGWDSASGRGRCRGPPRARIARTRMGRLQAAASRVHAEPPRWAPCTVPSAEPALLWVRCQDRVMIKHEHADQKLSTPSARSFSRPEASVYCFKESELISRSGQTGVVSLLGVIRVVSRHRLPLVPWRWASRAVSRRCL